ncbi:MAG: NACHT domain-containing protein [bacterium]|nr:NACHT domain-containing protein [bacterium]
MSPIDFPRIYNPGNQTREELIENFVIRREIFQDIFDDLASAEMKYPEQHYIIQGVRGQGKTTLLLRIAYEILNNKKLHKRLIPVIFNEDQYNISRLFKLWETIAEYLDEENEISGLYEEMQKIDDDDDYESRCFALLEQALVKRKRKLILFIDNIDALLQKFSPREHKRLREIFLESGEIRIVGASSGSLQFHYDYGHSFYQFFKTPQLRGLSTDETKTLLLKLGQLYKRERVKEIVENQVGRVEALRRLTEGVIRFIILLCEIFVDDNQGDAFMDLEKILDSVTPLYKQRMDSLTPQQQEIVDFIALSWDAVGTREIAQKTKLASKAVSAQIKQLDKYHIIDKIETDTKNMMYRISERFFNIWYLMRHGRKWDEKRIRFLIEFLQSWCDRNELKNRAAKHLTAILSGTINERQALYMTKALARPPIRRNLQHALLGETKSCLTGKSIEMKDYVSASDFDLSEQAKKAIQSSEIEVAIGNFEKIKKKSINEIVILGSLYAVSGQNLKKAEKYYLMAADKGHAGAMNNLAWLYFEMKKTKEKALIFAEEAYTNQKNIYIAHTLGTILLWNNEIQRAIEISNNFLEIEDALEKFPEDVVLFLMLLMAKKQYHLTLNIFRENPHYLIDRFKPVYYALMHFLKEEFPNEHRKMGGELEETVDEIINKIMQMESDYR